MHLSLPYIKSHKSLLCDPAEGDQLTTWSVNAIKFLPTIIQHLYATKDNLPLVDRATNVTCQQVAAYTARYHGNNFGLSACQCHGTMDSVLYPKLVHKQHTCSSPNSIISAALSIVNTFSTALTHPQEWYSKGGKVLTHDRVERKLQESRNMLNIIYSTIKTRTKIVNVHDIIQNLGE